MRGFQPRFLAMPLFFLPKPCFRSPRNGAGHPVTKATPRSLHEDNEPHSKSTLMLRSCRLPGILAAATFVQTARFTLTNAAADVPFVFVGLQAPATIWCGTCKLGVQHGSVLTTTLGSTLDIRIPAELRLLGVRVAVQGLGFGSGPCSPGAMRLSDTIDVTVL